MNTSALRGAAVLALAWVLAGLWPTAAAAESKVAFSIEDDRITESSGLTRDPDGNRYWTINDEGSTVYAVSESGEVTGTFTFRADTVDPEAIAMLDNRVYVADIGDNDEQRELITVYYFDNPSDSGEAVTYKSWDFRYADGPHNAETLLVDSSGRLFIVTKGSKGAIYAAPSDPETAGVNVLDRVAAAPQQVTDGVFLEGDDQIALLTKNSVEVIDAESYDEVASEPMKDQPQPESITLDLAGDNLLVGSEGKNSKVYSMPVPAAGQTQPSSSAEPSAEPPGSQSPADSDDVEVPEEDPEANTGSSRSGTYLALGIAGAVAVVAGAVVALVRKPS